MYYIENRMSCKVDKTRLSSRLAAVRTVRYIGQRLCYSVHRKMQKTNAAGKGECAVRGYFTANGYYGLVNGRYRLFASESDYFEMLSEDEA